MTTPGGPETRQRSGPVPGPVGRALARVYAAEISRRNARFDEGVGVARLDRPVISVGNLSVGGTGKTPLVTWLVERLLEAGHRPCVAMRGYRAKGGIADEAAIYRKRFLDLPIVAQPDRRLGLEEHFASAEGREVDCVLLDDGFQHRRIARDLDIVLIDATRSVFGDELLPAGWLREPVGSLARADAVVLTHAERVDERALDRLRGRVVETAPGATLCVTRHVWSGLEAQRHAGEEALEIGWLSDQRVLGVCAIGNPDAFFAEARRHLGDSLVGEIRLRDHDPYASRTVRRLIRRAEHGRADVILTTEKDWVKLARVPEELWPCSLARPRLEIAFDEGEAELGALALGVVGSARGPGAERAHQRKRA